MPARRRKPSKAVTAKSKKRAKTNNDDSASDDDKIVELYNACVNNSTTLDEGLQAISQSLDRGDLQSVIWPHLLQKSNDTEHWKKACHLLALLLSVSCREGSFAGQASTTSTLDFMLQESSNVEVLDKILTTLLKQQEEGDSRNYDFMAVVVHLMTVLLANLATHAEFYSILLKHMSGLEIWQSMPKRRREYELKTGTGGMRRKYAALSPLQQQPIWVVTLLDQLLAVIEGRSQYGNVFAQGSSTDKPGVEEEQDMENVQEDKDEETSDAEIETKVDNEAESDMPAVPPQVFTFLHRSLELLIDLLSGMTTRQYLAPYMEAIRFILRCQRVIDNEKNVTTTLVGQLLERIDSLLSFPLDPILKRPLSKAGMVAKYHARATMLQKMCHKHYLCKTEEVVYASVGMVCNASFLKRALGGLTSNELVDLVYRLRLIESKDDATSEHALQILLYHVEIPPHPMDQLGSFPLYPTESILWDFNLIPPGHVNNNYGTVLSLPKLNAQFLTYDDYLLRNLELVRLESAYEIRSDLTNVIARVRPVLRQASLSNDEEQDDVGALTTVFDGWARMALELDAEVQILKVAPPQLGKDFPAQVVAEITLDLQHCGQAIRQEWDALSEFDVLFLVGIDASQATREPAPMNESTQRPIQNEDDANFAQRFGVIAVRGCMVLHVRDEAGNILSDPANRNQQQGEGADSSTTKRILRVELDPAQYAIDARRKNGLQVYDTLNLVVRRHGRENNFKAVLETIRGLMEGSGSIDRVLPPWLQQLLLGYADPKEACYKSEAIKAYANKTAGVTKPDAALDYGDTFLDEEHLRSCFDGSKFLVDGREELDDDKVSMSTRRNYQIKIREEDGEDGSTHQIVEATSYPFPQGVSGNPVRFTPVQVEAVRSGLSPGLTVVVGPPGTGKTDVAVQIIANLYHSFPTQRTVIITHSNAALNDLFEKVMARGDIEERYMIRLGSGERDLKTSSAHDFTKAGRVEHSLAQRAVQLEKVQLLSESLGISGKAERGTDGSPSYTCETAEYFDLHHVQKRIRLFEDKLKSLCTQEERANVFSIFPFKKYFGLEEKDGTMSAEEANKYFSELRAIFVELAEYRPLEMLRSLRQRTDYLLMKQAKIVAMTCTHAAIVRSHLIELGFHYDNVIMEEAGQMMEVETFIPLLLQRGESDETALAPSRLKRVCLIGDHHQLPPVVKNRSFSNFSNLDQSLFSRLIRLGFPYIQLDRQGRARADIASLYSWRYNHLGDLDHVLASPSFKLANAGFLHTYQAINVEKFQGRGETTPTAYFYQNVGEAEYAVALFQFMVLIGYPPECISILTTYNGQKALLNDILDQRCGGGTPLAGMRPGAVSTVDQYQGQQNDMIILSLVRTEAVGHLRDVRRLVVAVSRARLGLYVLCCTELFANCHELKGTMDHFALRPNKLQLVLGEHYPTERKIDDVVPKEKIFEVEDLSNLGSIVHSMQEEWVSGQQ